MFLGLGSSDSLAFKIVFEDGVKINDDIDEKVFIVYPLLNGKRLNDESVCVDLYDLAVIYQRVKNNIKKSEIKPYVCVCGDNGCIGVFSSLDQTVGQFNVSWEKPKEVLDEAAENEDIAQYLFLEKNKYTFNKKQFLSEIDNLFNQIKNLKEEGKGKTQYNTFSFYNLNNAILLWEGKEPVFKSHEDIVKEAIKAGEDVDPTEVLTVKDILNKLSQEIKTEDNDKK